MILISGRGSNMRSVVEAKIAGAKIAAVISNCADAAGLLWADQQGIHTQVVSHQEYRHRHDFDQALMRAIDAYAPDLVLLAGFMRILGSEFCQHYAGRLINIHPSLLPAFAGLNTHQRALDSGCRIAGCTVHFVTPDLDNGPIIAQAVVPVQDEDNAQTLAARVLQAEHRLLPQVVADFVADRLRIDGLRVHGSRVAQSCLSEGFYF